MKICIPTEQDQGLDSRAYRHFGSAPHFIICDTESNTTRVVDNKDQHHEHGACLPAAALSGERVDAVIVGGIGGRALARLSQMDIKAYQSIGGPVVENLKAFKAGQLKELASQDACLGHGHDYH